jgi:glycosyltransferase involved in cell wall biosynthesis
MVQESETDREYLISIIIATFNAGEHLKACLLSIRNISVKQKIQVIVVDGGSKDQTLSILEEIRFPGLEWISEPDKGIYDALNKGIKMAKGRWLHFLGSDDLLLPGFSEMAEKLRSPNTVYYGIPKGYYLKDKKPDFILLAGKFSGYRMAKYCLNHQVILYPASVFLRYGYQLKYKVLADYALNLQVWGDDSFKKKFIPVEIALYNMTGFSAFSKDELFEEDKPKIIRECLGLFVYWRWLFKVYKKKLRGETF